MQEILLNSKIKLDNPTIYYDDIWFNNEIIRINGEYENSVLLAKHRPYASQD